MTVQTFGVCFVLAGKTSSCVVLKSIKLEEISSVIVEDEVVDEVTFWEVVVLIVEVEADFVETMDVELVSTPFTETTNNEEFHLLSHLSKDRKRGGRRVVAKGCIKTDILENLFLKNDYFFRKPVLSD